MSQKKVKAERKLRRMNGVPEVKKNPIKITDWREVEARKQELKKSRPAREKTGFRVFGKREIKEEVFA